MTYLLDTNVVSHLRRRNNVSARAAAWFRSVHPTQLFVASMTIFEIEHGILQLARRDSGTAGLLRSWLQDHVLTAFDGRILAIDADVALQSAALHANRIRLDRDRFIAATAIVYASTVVTRNVKDFTPLTARVLDPFA